MPLLQVWSSRPLPSHLCVPGAQNGHSPGLLHSPAAQTAHVPPPLPPTLFAAPEKHQVVPGVRPPEARSDLVDLMRVVNDHIAAAMGVPASVIFEGKFSSNSMSQLQLLNSTIQSIAISVNKVLTATYHACYDDAKEGDELTLLTAPLCSTAELQSLFEAGVIDIESALPAALPVCLWRRALPECADIAHVCVSVRSPRRARLRSSVCRAICRWKAYALVRRLRDTLQG